MSWFPSELPMMYIRQHDLSAALEALRATGVPLIGFVGSTPYPVGCPGDSPGLYYIVPLLARATGLSLGPTLLLVFGGALALALGIGLVCWWAYARSALWRVVGSAALVLLCYWSLRIGDIYTLSTALPIATVPAFLLLWRRAAPPLAWLVAVVLTGLFAGVAGLVRSEAGVVAPLFVAALALLQARQSLARRALLVLALGAVIALPVLGMRRVEQRRDAYLARALPGYIPPMHVHPIWHNVYIGFGFLSNDYGLLYKDGVAFGRVAAVSPGTRLCTPQYEAVVRAEVFRLVLRHPGFAAATVAAKAGTIGLFLVVFGNIGLIAAVRARKPRVVEVPFAVALLAGALPGLLVIPASPYLEGFTALALLYGLVSLDWAAAGRHVAKGSAPDGGPGGADAPATSAALRRAEVEV